jgi:3-hydroxy acid dehydrogenase/malonic semialdehyde reductase
MRSSIYKTNSLSGKRVLVTGASAGIGRACALLFAEQGCSLVLVARRAEKLIEVREEIQQLFPECPDVMIEVCDISQPEEVQSLVRGLEDISIDILINNAGLALGVDSGDRISMSDVQVMINTNVVGLMALVNGIAPQMRAGNSGDIVNISSVAAFDHYSGGAIYCATKAAVDAYSDCLRMDLVDTNIRVIEINPGLVSGTEFSVVRFRGDSEKAKTPYEGVDCLTALDIADQVVYAVTRPNNVQIAQIRCYCNQQAHARYVFSRK